MSVGNYTPERRWEDKANHRKIGIVVGIIFIVVMAGVITEVSQLSPAPSVGGSTLILQYQNEPTPYTVTVAIDSIQIGTGSDAYVVRPSDYSDISSLPKQLDFIPTPTSVGVDADRISTFKYPSIPTVQGTGYFYAQPPPIYKVRGSNVKVNDDQIPDIKFSITNTWQTDVYGKESTEYAKQRADGRFEYFFMVGTLAQTQTGTSGVFKLCSQAWNEIEGIQMMEVAPTQVAMYLKITINNNTSDFGIGSVFNVHHNTLTSNNSTKYFDDPPCVEQDQQVPSAFTPANIDRSNGKLTFIIGPISGILQAGEKYTYNAVWPEYPDHITGFSNSIDVYLTYNILFSVILPEAPEQPANREWWWQIYDYLIGVLEHPTDNFTFWLIVAGLIILLIVWKLSPKKAAKAQATTIIQFPPAPPAMPYPYAPYPPYSQLPYPQTEFKGKEKTKRHN